MGEKQEIKIRLSTLLLIIALIVIVIMGYYIYKLSSKNEVISGNENNTVSTSKVGANETENNTVAESNTMNKTIDFDKSKCINGDFSNYMTVKKWGMFYDAQGVELNINTQDNVVLCNVDYKKIYELDEEKLKENSGKNTDEIKLEFNKKVESIYVAGFGQDILGTVYFFLMEDGSLEYMKYFDIYENKKFEHKLVEGANDIVKVDTIYVSEDSAGGGCTSIAYKMDGTFYDLSKLIDME